MNVHSIGPARPKLFPPLALSAQAKRPAPPRPRRTPPFILSDHELRRIVANMIG
jgi:hypothetical protein